MTDFGWIALVMITGMVCGTVVIAAAISAAVIADATRDDDKGEG